MLGKSKTIISGIAALILFITSLPHVIYAASSDGITITEAAGCFESVYVKWTGGDGIEKTNVYYKKTGTSEYIMIDRELIREYKDYIRADIPGLAAGEYTVKIVPASDGAENESGAAETDILTVSPYTREGFAFSSQSPCGTTNGGYNSDGTPKANADIIYVSNGNVNRVMVGGTSEYGIGLVGIFDYRERNSGENPLIVRIIGRVDMPEGMQKYLLGIRETADVTIEGIGEDAAIHGFGITFKNAKNIELRNFAIMWYGGGTDSDATALDGNNDNIWIHNIEYFYGAHGPDDDQSKGDGSIDMKNQSDYVTISYCHFWDSGKSTFTDSPSSESSKTHVTYHHNWFDHSDSRHPRCVGSDVHLYNNYYDGVSKYGIGAAEGSSVFAENNYFRYCPRPMIIASQGSDVYKDGAYNGKSTLSGQSGGMIKGYGNYIGTHERFMSQLDTADEGQIDCYIVSSRNEQVPNTVKALKGGAVYSNFDTADTMYSYSVDTAEDGMQKVKDYAGRLNGGDFKYEFDNNTQDANYNVITELQNAVFNYSPGIVKIGGDATLEPELPPAESEYRITHNFTTQETQSDFYSISGTVSPLFGSMRYDATNLTKSLKFEGSASIAFTPEYDGTLTLVANPYKGTVKVKVNGADIQGDSTTGLITFPVTAKVPCTITRSSIAYLFYIVLEYEQYDPAVTSDPNATPKPSPAPKETEKPNIPVGDRVTHNFTTQATESTFFTITGTSLKTNRGSAEYKGETLTTCCEIGSNTSIKFTAPKNGKCTFVFSPGGKAEGKINGTTIKGNSATGIMSIDVTAGQTYELTKSSTANLFYIDLELESDESPTPTPETTSEPTASPCEKYLYEIQDCEFGADGKLKISLKYNGSGGDTAKLIIASYADSGSLINARMFDITDDKVSNLDYVKPTDGSVKFFIWDLETLKPLSESK